jgi:hypothetical protein
LNIAFKLVVIPIFSTVLAFAVDSTELDTTAIESFSPGGTETEIISESPDAPGGDEILWPSIDPISTTDPTDEECDDKPGYKVAMVVVDGKTRCEYVKDPEEPISDVCENKRLMFGALSNLLGIMKSIDL